MTDTASSSAQETAQSFIVREATPADDAGIRMQIRRNAMPGRISLAASHDPGFFASAEVEGHERHVVVGERDGQIIGVGLMAKKRLYLNGDPCEIGYMSSLRADPSIRGTTALARGTKVFKQWHNEGFGVPFYLCSILQENTLARRLVTGGRHGMPMCREVGTLYTATIPLLRRSRMKPPAGLRVVRGGEVGAEAVIECLNRCGRLKQFYPVYTVEDLTAEGGILRGLRLEDFHVALSGGRVVGVTACWNQLPFRQVIVAGYSGIMRFVKPLLSPLARVLRLAPLPNPGDAVHSVTAACIAIEDNDPGIFKSLLHSVLCAEHNTGKTFLMVGLMEQDPLLSAVRPYLHLPTRSCVYALQWDGADVTEVLDGRTPYIELGSL